MCTLPGIDGGPETAHAQRQRLATRQLSFQEQVERSPIKIPTPEEAMLAERPTERRSRGSFRIPKGTVEVSRIRIDNGG
jgi:hypothetical protein